MENLSRRSFLHKMGMGAGTTATVLTLPALLNLSASHAKAYEGKKLNIALCGLGRYATYLAEGIAVSQYCRVAGIVTGTPSKAVEWKKMYSIPEANIYNYQNFDAIARNKDIDLVYVVLPNSMHKEFTIRANKAIDHRITKTK